MKASAIGAPQCEGNLRPANKAAPESGWSGYCAFLHR
jgi:hypothetical protein